MSSSGPLTGRAIDDGTIRSDYHVEYHDALYVCQSCGLGINGLDLVELAVLAITSAGTVSGRLLRRRLAGRNLRFQFAPGLVPMPPTESRSTQASAPTAATVARRNRFPRRFGSAFLRGAAIDGASAAPDGRDWRNDCQHPATTRSVQ